MAKKKYYQRKDGLYEAIRVIKGKRVAFRGRSCREVDQKIAEYQSTPQPEQNGRTFPIIADEWEKEHEKTISESSRRVYSYAVKRLKEAFPGFASEIRPLDVKRYITAFERKGYALDTVQIELSVCKMIFAHAVLAGDIDVNPATEVRKSKGLPCRKREALTEEQEAIVKKSADKPFGLFPLFLLYTGLRRGEALALTYADIDRKAGVIHVTKKLSYVGRSSPVLENWTKSENGIRDVPLLKPLADALPQNHIGLIFPGENGYMMSHEIVKNWRNYCRAVGFVETCKTGKGKIVENFPITPHCLRHSFATICYEAGLDIRQAAKICGDTPETLEKVYTHLREGQQLTGAEKLAAYFDRADSV